MEVKIKRIKPGYEDVKLPKYQTEGSAGMDVCAAIDSDYRGEIGALLMNNSDTDFVVARGMRIAQLVVAPVKNAELVEVESLDTTKRNTGGYGSTGL